jgi:hypothetical protein
MISAAVELGAGADDLGGVICGVAVTAFIEIVTKTIEIKRCDVLQV